VGQVWLIDLASFEAYLKNASNAIDQRFEPKL
jgi:hypothetical protein